MTKILVTGATGNIGRSTLKHLLDRRPATDLVGLARDPAKAADLAARGIAIRQGDYFDHDGLVRAFADIETLMLVSATAFTDRNTQHETVISAARQAGVRHIVFMPVIHEPGSTFSLPQVTAEDLFVEDRLEASGLAFTLVRHPPFLQGIPFLIGAGALERGVQMPAGAGKAGFASRDDLAEAQAALLSEAGHENRRYALYGDPALSFAEIAAILSEISGRPVPYLATSDEDYLARLTSAGLPAPAAAFALDWVHGINAGAWAGKTNDLETLLGRKPVTATEFLRGQYGEKEG